MPEARKSPFCISRKSRFTSILRNIFCGLVGRRPIIFRNLLQALETCPDDSIFQHTFRTLQEHHFIRQGFSNDFAHWSLFASMSRPWPNNSPASTCASSLRSRDLRRRMVEISAHIWRTKTGLDPGLPTSLFYFCASDIVVPADAIFVRHLRRISERHQPISVHSIHHHFIEARLRLHRMSNDFSHGWKKKSDCESGGRDRANRYLRQHPGRRASADCPHRLPSHELGDCRKMSSEDQRATSATSTVDSQLPRRRPLPPRRRHNCIPHAGPADRRVGDRR